MIRVATLFLFMASCSPSAEAPIEKPPLQEEEEAVTLPPEPATELEPEFLPTVVVKENGWNFKIYLLRDRPNAGIYSERWMLDHVGLPRWSHEEE